MTRKNQKLINYHGSNRENLAKENLYLGEIAVVHNEAEPLLGIHISGETKDEIAFFVASAGVMSMIDTKMVDVLSDIGELRSDVDTLSGEVVSNYATKVELETAKDAVVTSAANVAVVSASSIAEAKDAALANEVLVSAATMDGVMSAATFESAKTYADATFATLEGLETAKNAVFTSATSVAAADAQSKDEALANDLVASAASIADAKDEALANEVLVSAATMDGVMSAATFESAKTYADATFATLEGLETAKHDVFASAVSVASNDAVVSAASMIAASVSTTYRYSGSVQTVNDLPASAAQVGLVYNVIEANGNPGDSGYTPAGTNYAWTGGEWDALGGVVDLSAYATTTWVSSNFSETGHTHEGMATQTDVANASARTAELAATNLKTFSGSIISEIIDNEDATAAALNDIKADIASTSARTFQSAKTYADATFATLEGLETAKNAVVTSAANVAVVSASSIAEAKDAALANEVLVSAATMDGVMSAATFESAKTYADAEIGAASARTFQSAITVMQGNYATKEELATAKNDVFTSATSVAAADAQAKDETLANGLVTSAASIADAKDAALADKVLVSAATMDGVISAATFESAKTYADATFATAAALETAKDAVVTSAANVAVVSAASIAQAKDEALANDLVASAASIADAKDATLANGVLVSAATMDGVMSAATFESAKTYADATFATKTEMGEVRDIAEAAISGVTFASVTTSVGDAAYASGVKASATPSGNIALDFTSLEIDCGEF